MTRIFVIFNPAARGEKSQRLRQFLESKKSDRVTLAPTQCAGDATRLAAAAGDHDIVVAAGGDGTINEVINGLNGATLGRAAAGHGQRLRARTQHPSSAPGCVGVDRSRSKRARLTWRARKRPASGDTFAKLAGVGFDARAVRTASWETKEEDRAAIVCCGLPSERSGNITTGRDSAAWCRWPGSAGGQWTLLRRTLPDVSAGETRRRIAGRLRVQELRVP